MCPFTKNTKIVERLNFKFSANFFNALNMHSLISQGNGRAVHLSQMWRYLDSEPGWRCKHTAYDSVRGAV